MNTGQHIYTQKISISLHLLVGVGKGLMRIAIGVLVGVWKGCGGWVSGGCVMCGCVCETGKRLGLGWVC